MTPLALMTTIPSTAESMMARQRASAKARPVSLVRGGPELSDMRSDSTGPAQRAARNDSVTGDSSHRDRKILAVGRLEPFELLHFLAASRLPFDHAWSAARTR